MKQTAVEFILEKMQSGKWEYTTWAEREQIIEQAKEMEKQQQGYSEEEVKNIMAETWIKCVGNDGNNFKKLRDKILEQFKKK